MNKKTITIIIATLVVVIGGAVAYALLRPNTNPDSSAEVTGQPAVTDTQPTDQPAQTEADKEATEQKEGQYVNYDGKAIETTEGRKLIFFHAAWCPQCRALEQSILDGTIPSGVTIFKANFDLETQLKQRYGVTQQTTIIEVNDQGDELKQFNAYYEPSLQALVKEFGL